MKREKTDVRAGLAQRIRRVVEDARSDEELVQRLAALLYAECRKGKDADGRLGTEVQKALAAQIAHLPDLTIGEWALQLLSMLEAYDQSVPKLMVPIVEAICDGLNARPDLRDGLVKFWSHSLTSEEVQKLYDAAKEGGA